MITMKMTDQYVIDLGEFHMVLLSLQLGAFSTVNHEVLIVHFNDL
jgi:hypothetical protein